jgi:photosystem II stability/assembly factor-like uncharacterized protein
VTLTFTSKGLSMYSMKLAIVPVLSIICGFGLTLNLGSCASDSNQSDDPYLHVQFVTSAVGWIVGPRLLQTTDGGKNWKVIQGGGSGTVISETVVADLHRFQFINSEVGIARDRDVFKKTSDGGRTWQELSISADNEHQLASFFFLDTRQGWVAGKNVYFTSDGGQNWQRLASTPTGDPRHQREMRVAPELANYRPLLRFTTAKDGVMAKLDGMAHVTNDGGITWQYVFDAGKPLRDVFFYDTSNGWLVGNAGLVVRTRDGGRTWTHMKTPTTNDLLAVHFINSNSGCAVGAKCTIICTMDGGTTWNTALVKSLPEMPPLLASVSFADELNGWAVGGFGAESSWRPIPAGSSIALTTKDGGKTWEPVNLPH